MLPDRVEEEENVASALTTGDLTDNDDEVELIFSFRD